MQHLYEKYRDQGFEVLAFPCNQFGHQEPGTEAQIKATVRGTYRATFPLFRKILVNGPKAEPLFSFLKESFGMHEIPWNFQKFLVGRDGKPKKQLPPQANPMSFEKDIKRLLKQA
mmetsp:Transcript_14112/g.33326  ORF Transcript_14112/g.33326 Transcript_14112/m.33326 type:complete len:115 (-) Transcript_14112:57-401(-)